MRSLRSCASWQRKASRRLRRSGSVALPCGVRARLSPRRRSLLVCSYFCTERRHERARLESESGGAAGAQSLEGTPAPSDNQPTPNPASTTLPARGSLDETGNDTGGEIDDLPNTSTTGNGKGSGFSARDAHPPQKKYRLTERMKEIIWQLVCMSNECCRLENEKKYAVLCSSTLTRLCLLNLLACLGSQLENNNQVVSDQGVRKTLYQKVTRFVPVSSDIGGENAERLPALVPRSLLPFQKAGCPRVKYHEKVRRQVPCLSLKLLLLQRHTNYGRTTSIIIHHSERHEEEIRERGCRERVRRGLTRLSSNTGAP